MQTPQKIAIVGSGLVGSLLAIYLRKAGHTVHIYDRSPDIRQIEFSGRSINLAMSNRGWKALDGVGVGDAVREIAIPMDKRAIHLVDKLNFQAYGQEGEAIYSISRGLLIFLNDKIFLNKRLTNKLRETFNINGMEVTGIGPFQFTEYKEGEYFDWHTDANNDVYRDRFTSIVIQLNNTYEGGTLEIKNPKGELVPIENKIGTLYIFNSRLFLSYGK